MEKQIYYQIPIPSFEIPKKLVKTTFQQATCEPDVIFILVEPMEELLCYHKLLKETGWGLKLDD